MSKAAEQPDPVPNTERSPRRGMCAAVLCLEAIALGLTTPVMITIADVATGTALAVGLGLAVVCLLLSVAFLVSWIRNRSLESSAIAAARGISAAESTGLALPSTDALRRLETLRASLATLALYNRTGAPLSWS